MTISLLPAYTLLMLANLAAVAPKQSQDTLLAEILPWLILLLGLVIAGGVVIYWVRRSMNAQRNADVGDTGFTLHELRTLHQDGKLSKDEYERARAALIGGFQSKADSNAADASDNADPA